MADLDVVGKRLDAAIRLRDKIGLVFAIDQPVYTGDKKTGVVTVYGVGLLDANEPAVAGEVENVRVVATIGALRTNVDGEFIEPHAVLLLKVGDLLHWEGRKLPILRPNAVAIAGPDQPILYDRLVAGVEKKA